MQKPSVHDAPRPVSRGVELQRIFLGIDSLYLVIEYPHDDVFRYWSEGIQSVDARRLHDGVPREDMLIRKGGLGYKYSVWTGDARLFITNRVDDNLKESSAAGQGMGVMLQLGPKWLCTHADLISYESFSKPIFDLLCKFKLKHPEKYPIRINRIDVALDVAGLEVANFSVDEWRQGWVGRASGKHFYDDGRSGNLSGLAIGSSKGALRFKVYDKLLESTKNGASGFWFSVWDVERFQYVDSLSVARFEWSFKPHSAKFINMRYLSDYSFGGLRELMNYATQKWGRLCVVQDSKNQSRWEIHPLWKRIRRLMIDEWDIDHASCAKREYHLAPDLNDSYLNSVTGWLGGLMARLGVANGYDKPAELLEAIFTAQKSGQPIQEKAEEKFENFLD